ncbi:uncharacterized protein PV09_05474 [Verruconis gallopava]|uniref:FAD/NAD(P)-binding domain-containing protein n=1 Tax=Verruconis gallopava TaxID=253628 RepID=A0A0D2A910_9PEZI|nr:uncharacterized protein PV09_05474 [Verruconis gallopava]KIW03253.1 hypothetical protein PV09_05474 [Verruconis gallopava]
MAEERYDAVIVGAGFAGIYMLHKLRDELNLKCLVIDIAGDVGGTWYWNLYPGAMSDTVESFAYRYSWDKEDLKTYPWRDHYVKQPEVLAYLQHITKKYDLRKDMRFKTELKQAAWVESEKQWHLDVSSGQQLVSRYLILGLGILSKANIPNIHGADTFKGEMYHTAHWPKKLSLDGKKVGIIGSGSTGVQVITEIGKKVESLTCFQRHPQYSVPSGDKEVDAQYRQWINDHYDDIFRLVRNSITGFGFEESKTSYHDVSPEERERIFQEYWDKGNGFRFMFGTFSDITTDRDANEAACDFIRKKIDAIVKDPEKARKLKPYDVYARRPLCDGQARGEGYYEQFNRDNVDIVHLGETPIQRIEPQGIRTSDGKLHELDMLIWATGFDAVEGNYVRLAIQGRKGKVLRDHWSDGPTSYLGVAIPGFPNMFMINGPKAAFTNQPPMIEVQVEFVADVIAAAQRQKSTSVTITATEEAERGWTKLCDELAANSLFWKAEDNWIFGANIPGKKCCLRFYFGGLQKYIGELQHCIDEGFKGFEIVAG